ncbi:MAG: MBL fold metallo-hydrolase [Erysipelotrichaceae bacterium]|nr:MBL fold metallo-hydrolase [Erysipelotrichaceae bacterium]
MRRYFPTSLFRPVLAAVLFLYSRSYPVLALGGIFLLFWDRREFLFYLLLCGALFCRLSFSLPPAETATVLSGSSEKGYLLRSDHGDLLAECSAEIPSYTDIRYRITETEDLKKTGETASLTRGITHRIRITDAEVISAGTRCGILEGSFAQYGRDCERYLRRFLCGESNYELPAEAALFGFGLYRGCRKLKRKYPYLAEFLPLFFYIHLCLFGYHPLLLLLVCDLLAERLGKKGQEHFAFVLLLLLLGDPYSLFRQSLRLALIFRLLNCFSYRLRKDTLVIMLQSYLFARIDLLRFLAFPLIDSIGIGIYLLSFLTACGGFPPQNYVLLLDRFFALFGSIPLAVKGRLSPFWILFLIVFLYVFRLEQKRLSLLVPVVFLLLRLQVPSASLTMIDVGHGDAIYYEDRLAHLRVLIDTGDPYHYRAVREALDAKGVSSLDWLIITHSDDDHAGNAEALQKDLRIGKVITEGEDLCKGNARFSWLPLPVTGDPNDDSLIYYLEADGLCFLFTGDISAARERELVQEYGPLKIDILKAAHHGSDTSSDPLFLQECDPSFALISANGRYGHPSAKTLQTLRSQNTIYYVTEKEGDVTLWLGRYFDLFLTEKGHFRFLAKKQRS